jgi:hypothetical protein
MKEATATKLQLLQVTQKKNSEVCPSNQVSAAVVTKNRDLSNVFSVALG